MKLANGLAVVMTGWPAMAMAQVPASGESLMSLDTGSLRGEVSTRYEAALALTADQTVIAANSSRFMWASQAKNQCGIALGFLKSGTRDPVSVGKCAEAYDRMRGGDAVAAPPPPPPVAACNTGPYIVFFDFDRSDITPEAAQVLESAVAANRNCNSAPMDIAGYTDRSGSDAYNLALSARRADSVRDFVISRGVDGGAITTQALGEINPRVPTADGVRELQNRRAEITFK